MKMFVYLARASCSNGTLQTQRKPYIIIIHAFIQRSLLVNPTNNAGWVAIWGQSAPIVLSRPPLVAPLTTLFLFYDASIGTVRGLIWADL